MFGYVSPNSIVCLFILYCATFRDYTVTVPVRDMSLYGESAYTYMRLYGSNAYTLSCAFMA